MPCSHCARPQGDDPGQCRDPETWACKDAQIARLTGEVEQLRAKDAKIAAGTAPTEIAACLAAEKAMGA